MQCPFARATVEDIACTKKYYTSTKDDYFCGLDRERERQGRRKKITMQGRRSREERRGNIGVSLGVASGFTFVGFGCACHFCRIPWGLAWSLFMRVATASSTDKQDKQKQMQTTAKAKAIAEGKQKQKQSTSGRKKIPHKVLASTLVSSWGALLPQIESKKLYRRTVR